MKSGFIPDFFIFDRMRVAGIFLSVLISTLIFVQHSCKQPYCGPPKLKNDCKKVLHLQFNGNLKDISVFNNVIIPHGSFTYGTDRNGNLNSAAYFNGSSNYLEIPHSPTFEGKSIAIMAWVWPSAFNTYFNSITSSKLYSGFYNKWDDASRKGISTYSTDVQARTNGHFTDGGFFDFGTTAGIFLAGGSWQHIAYVIANGEITIYRNGAVVGSKSTGNTSGLLTVNTATEIGRTKWYPSNELMLSYFTGYIDDLKIFYNCPDVNISDEMK